MDPTACLAAIRRIIAQADRSGPVGLDALRLADLVEALDTWLTGGGFPPAQWPTHLTDQDPF